jgi:N-methylhydantoinase A
MSEVTIGVDVGGTFTDLILFDAQDGSIRIAKVPSTVHNQAFGVMAALDSVDAHLPTVATIVHGTTTTTNALLERKLARTGLITTAGFRDILELGRRTRPTSYGLTGTFTPLIERELRMEVSERIAADGDVVRPLDEDAVNDTVDSLLAAGCESVVIHFLHAYKNSSHERRAAELVRAKWPNSFVTAGHEVLSEFREYERGVTAAVNALVQPILKRYLDSLLEQLESRGYTSELLVMRGNGGTVSARTVSESAVNTVMSGPASGVMAAAHVGRSAGVKNLVTYDMGGTSCDVGLIRGGVPAVSAELEVEYAMPIHVPMVDVHTIGAGGGSIASINEAGLLQVGPQSAGAFPGPIAYGRGGTLVTITDANLLLGRLNAKELLSVDGTPRMDAVREAMEAQIGIPLGLNTIDAAEAVIAIADNAMAGALRMVSLSRGEDPRDFALFAFGGAGPAHAASLARELGIPKVLVPARPGIINALGCLVADMRHDFVNTVNAPLAGLDMTEVRDIVEEQIERGTQLIEAEQVSTSAMHCIHSADMQFQGQSHLLNVEIPGPDVGREALSEAFNTAYWNRFGVELPEIRPVLVNLHTAVIAKRQTSTLSDLLDPKERATTLSEALVDSRQVRFARTWHETPIYRRERLPLNAHFEGPAVVEQLDTTTLVPPGCVVDVVEHANLMLSFDG